MSLTFSCEFFPPQSVEGQEKLRATRRQLAQLKPDFFSVTYGAGGSTRERTFATVCEIQQDGLQAVPHISCIASDRSEIATLLRRYQEMGIRRLVALRGDLPSGMADPGDFYYAQELVTFIREKTGSWFTIEVAAYPEYHPQALNPQEDLRHFVAKIRAGANAAITQYFYNADSYWHFVEQCAALGVEAPIVPGIMPIANFAKIARFSDACGAEVPRWIRRKMEGFGSDLASVRAFGLDVVTALCDQLLSAGAPGLHFYTLNQASLVSLIWQRLGLRS